MAAGCGAARRTGAARAALLATVAVSVALRVAAAQGVRELGAQAVVTTADPVLAAAGLYAAVRPSLRTRIALTAVAGPTLSAGTGGDVAGRAELLGHFLLAPTVARHAGVYVGGGLAGVVGPADRAVLVLVAGLEQRPGAPAGWALELGVGGGIRIAAGYRWRRFPAGWPRK
ncbi:MAG TPA: hypothetical protein VFW66_09315 [Gemmatimonadales bacterium]|nr:hypothetical protein [Gemmatimonadales bacterium]